MTDVDVEAVRVVVIEGDGAEVVIVQIEIAEVEM